MFNILNCSCSLHFPINSYDVQFGLLKAQKQYLNFKKELCGPFTEKIKTTPVDHAFKIIKPISPIFILNTVALD